MQARFDKGEIDLPEFEMYTGRYDDMMGKVFENNRFGDDAKKKYDEQTLLLKKLSTAKTADTFSGFGASSDAFGKPTTETKVFDQKDAVLE